MGVGGGGLSADEIRLAIVLLAETKGAVSSIKSLENQLNSLRANAAKTKAELKGLFDKGIISQATYDSGVKQVNKSLGDTPPKIDNVKKSLISMNNIARTAFGTFVAMGIFLVTQFVGNAIKKTIDGVKQLELAVFNLAVAEKSLSEQGIDITPQDFKEIITAVEALGLAISKIDITKGVANLATGLRDLGLSKTQLEELSKAAAIIATSKGLSMENVVGQLVGGIAKGGRGLADLDIQVDEAVIKQKALDEQLVKSEEEWNNLTAAQKQSIETQALYLIVLESAADKLANLGLLEGSVTIAQQELNSAWEDFTAEAGVRFAPFIVGGLELITKGLIGLGKSLQIVSTIFQMFFTSSAANFFTLRDIINLNVRSVDDLKDAYVRNYTVAKAIVKDLFATPDLPADTPTGTPSDTVSEIEEQAEDIVGALEKANDEILKAQLKLEQDLQDIAIDLGRKMQDITTEYANKRADVERDYANKIGDINRDTQSKIADINRKAQESKAKAHADQLEKEREFQNKLKEMQEDFLMDLDDALHARDARAILKLIKQYELEKLQAERKHGLDQTNSKKDEQLRQQSYAAERKEAEEEGRAKLADAQRDYALKMAKLKADEEAEVVAAVLAANRKTEDTLKANNDRLAIIAADLVNQFNLTKAGLDAVLALYQMYYGDGGFISQVMAGMQSTLAGQNAPAQVTTPARSGGRSTGGGGTQHRAMAEGGTIIANRPTTVTFGEAGLEEASFRPIGRTGMDVNKIFSALGSGGGDGSNGMVTIALDLSPDIEARITKNTMNKTAQIITKTRRSK